MTPNFPRSAIFLAACLAALTLTAGTQSNTDCPNGLVGGCARCEGVRYEEGIQFGTCELPGPHPAGSLDPDDTLEVEPADNCYGFEYPGFCFSADPGVTCPDEFICCAGGAFGYWTCDQLTFGCEVEHWCDEFCCVNEPTLRTDVTSCPGNPLTMIHYCE